MSLDLFSDKIGRRKKLLAQDIASCDRRLEHGSLMVRIFLVEVQGAAPAMKRRTQPVFSKIVWRPVGLAPQA